MTWTRPYRGILTTPPPPMDAHRPGRLLMRLRGTPLPPATCTSFPLPWRTSPYLGVVISGPPRGRVCCTGGIGGWGGQFPSSRTTVVSLFTKCTQRVLQLEALPRNTTVGNVTYLSTQWKYTQYVRGFSRRGWVCSYQVPLYHPVSKLEVGCQ